MFIRKDEPVKTAWNELAISHWGDARRVTSIINSFLPFIMSNNEAHYQKYNCQRVTNIQNLPSMISKELS